VSLGDRKRGTAQALPRPPRTSAGACSRVAGQQIPGGIGVAPSAAKRARRPRHREGHDVAARHEMQPSAGLERPWLRLSGSGSVRQRRWPRHRGCFAPRAATGRRRVRDRNRGEAITRAGASARLLAVESDRATPPAALLRSRDSDSGRAPAATANAPSGRLRARAGTATSLARPGRSWSSASGSVISQDPPDACSRAAGQLTRRDARLLQSPRSGTVAGGHALAAGIAQEQQRRRDCCNSIIATVSAPARRLSQPVQSSSRTARQATDPFTRAQP
jgi:hypothetical protein